MKHSFFAYQERSSSLRLDTLAQYGAVALFVIAAVLAVINLPYSPRTWYDEGSHLHVPKTFVQDGVYADKSAEGYRFHGPTVGVGPTVMLPIAGVFKIFGIGLTQGRAVIVVYLLISLVAFYAVATKLQGRLVAFVAIALLLASRTFSYDGIIEYGRQVLGEVPGFSFLTLGMLAWITALQRLQRARLSDPTSRSSLQLCVLAGLGFGLALLTKNQFVLIVPPAIALTALLDWLYYRAGDWRLRIIPLIVACACFGILTFLQYQFLGAGTFAKTVEETRKAASGAIFVFDIRATLRAGYYLVRPDLYGGLLILGLAYSLWRALQRTANGLTEGAVAVLVGLWLLWFVGASLGWPRYAFPAVAFGSIGVARLVVDSWAALASRRRWFALLFAAYVGVAVLIPITLTANDVLHPDDSAQQFAAYIDAHVPQDALIATWEQELGFLTNHRYQYPPQSALADAVRRQWFGGAAAKYDWESAKPAYVAIGPFGDYTEIFNVPALDNEFVLVQQTGLYKLYERRKN